MNYAHLLLEKNRKRIEKEKKALASSSLENEKANSLLLRFSIKRERERDF